MAREVVTLRWPDGGPEAVFVAFDEGRRVVLDEPAVIGQGPRRHTFTVGEAEAVARALLRAAERASACGS